MKYILSLASLIILTITIPAYGIESFTDFAPQIFFEYEYSNRIDQLKEFFVDEYLIKYIFHEYISTSQINITPTEINSIDFNFNQIVNGTLVLMLQDEMISETLIVVNEDNVIIPHLWAQHNGFSIVEIDIIPPSKTITLGAVHVTPEYLDIAILGSIIGAIIGISVYIKYKHPKLTILN